MTGTATLLALVLASMPWSLRRSIGHGIGDSADKHRDEPDPVLLLALLDAAMTAGAPLPRALQVVGRAVGGRSGDGLSLVGGRLTLGSAWTEAVDAAPTELRPLLDAVADTWTVGTAPGPLLRRAAERLTADRQTRTRAAAARLGVRLVLPLGLCLLPSFILLGLVPVVLSLVGTFLG